MSTPNTTNPTPETPREGSQWPRTFRALRHRNFRLFWLGQMFSLVGTWMHIVAQGWLVYRLTGSPLMLGIVNVVGLLPVVPISLMAGVISDRFPRRKLILVTELLLVLEALVLAILVWQDVVQVWHIIVLSFILGVATSMEQPARVAFIAETVGKEDLTNAIALNASIFNAARIVGPALAGLVVARWGEATVFFINTGTYFTVIIALLMMHIPNEAVPRDKGKLHMGSSLVDGMKFIWQTPNIRALMAIVGVSSFLTLPYVTLMPAIARDVLHVDEVGLGFLMGALGVGAIIGALAVAGVLSGRRGNWLTWGDISGSVFLVLFALTTSYSWALGLIVFVGAFNAIRQALSNSLIQIHTPDELQGRVVSVFNLLFNGLSRMGALVVGGLGEVISVPLALGICAGISLVWSGFVIWKMPYIRRLE